MKVSIKELEWGDVFSFSKKGAFHMVWKIGDAHIEYKSFQDGKIRVEYLKRQKEVFLRPERSRQFEVKWFDSDIVLISMKK